MEQLGTIYRHPVANIAGRKSCREAVRAIILRGQALLMVYSPVNGDYKFPGGGVDRDEDHATALRREVLEECGANLTHVGAGFGKVVEYDQPIFPGYDVFQMTSYYYLCEVNEHRQPQRLDKYEADLQFEPVWVDITEAVRVNQAVLDSTGRGIPSWTNRETLVLQQIRSRFFPHDLDPEPGVSTSIPHCPECGAAWLAGNTCEANFHRLLFWEAEQPALGEVHHLMVLCYHLQHPSLYSPEGLRAARELLAQFIDLGVTPEQAIRQHRHQVDTHQRNWKITATPKAKADYPTPPTWVLTIADVAAAGPAHYCETVRQWAAETLKAIR